MPANVTLPTTGAGSFQPDVSTVLAADGSHIQVVQSGSTFKALLKFEPATGTELRADETTTDRYHGAATDGTATSAASWAVVRFYKNSAGDITRVRYRTGVVWDSRTAGWT